MERANRLFEPSREFSRSVRASGLTTVYVVTMPPGIFGKASGMEVQIDQKKNSKPLKGKTTKAERRAIKEDISKKFREKKKP
ncbi:hypothetical protein ISN44_As10g005040 [Arabidopsis suecica]|uniref:Uncharacterized protein n=1 Tax=Arabidopsis suecica TaxID=45249 RepID=A0A8T1ZW08_ARASU|nr:hypothetical protein ISN44_As10g005040 [Arabidopsis suecica]